MSTKTDLISAKLLIFDWQGTLADNSGDLFSGVRETLDELKKKGYTLVLATSMPEERMSFLLNENSLNDYFAMVQTGDMGYQKPDPKMLYAILEASHQSVDDAVMIGDSIADLKMAKDANMRAIGVLSGGDPQNILELAKPLLILNDVNELLNILCN